MESTNVIGKERLLLSQDYRQNTEKFAIWTFLSQTICFGTTSIRRWMILKKRKKRSQKLAGINNTGHFLYQNNAPRGKKPYQYQPTYNNYKEKDQSKSQGYGYQKNKGQKYRGKSSSQSYRGKRNY